MAKKFVSPENKLQAVLAVYNGSLSFKESAAQHNVSLSALYMWYDLFVENAGQLFRPCKPGPKPQNVYVNLMTWLLYVMALLVAEVRRLQKEVVQSKASNASPQMPSSRLGHNNRPSSMSFGRFLESGIKLLVAPIIGLWNTYNSHQGDLFDTEIPLNAPAHSCPNCEHQKIWKNGSYCAVNYIFKFLFRFLPHTKEKVHIQRHICAECKKPVHSFLKIANTYCREQFHKHMIRAIALCKFYFGLSLRQIQGCCQWFYQHGLSLHTIAGHVDKIGERAGIFFEGLSTLPQKTARVLMLDEMFIKIKGTIAYLCLAVDENGLIRGVRLLKSRSADELKKIIGQTLGPNFQPSRALTDFWKGYDEAISDLIGKTCSHYHDVVHAMRICFRHVNDAVRKTRLIIPTEKRKNVSLKNFKKFLYPTIAPTGCYRKLKRSKKQRRNRLAFLLKNMRRNFQNLMRS